MVTAWPFIFLFSPNVGKYKPEKFPHLDTFNAVGILHFCCMAGRGGAAPTKRDLNTLLPLRENINTPQLSSVIKQKCSGHSLSQLFCNLLRLPYWRGRDYHPLGCLSQGTTKTIANLLGSIFSQLNILVDKTSCKVDQGNAISRKLTVQYQRAMLTNQLIRKNVYSVNIYLNSTTEILDTPQRGWDLTEVGFLHVNRVFSGSLT